MGNVWLILGSEKDQDWYKWLLNHDFRRWYCVDNSARVCAFKGTENKARASVHAGGAEFLIHLWALIDCECGGNGHASQSRYKRTKSISCRAFYGKFTQPVLAKNRFPLKLRF